LVSQKIHFKVPWPSLTKTNPSFNESFELVIKQLDSVQQGFGKTKNLVTMPRV
jgi:hypothetical protein